MLLYASDVLHGSKLHWLQWPVKYRLLTTSHSNTGRGFQWLLMHFEHIWCYDAVFSTLTRAMEVPGPVGASLAARAGCAGIVVMNNARGESLARHSYTDQKVDCTHAQCTAHIAYGSFIYLYVCMLGAQWPLRPDCHAPRPYCPQPTRSGRVRRSSSVL